MIDGGTTKIPGSIHYQIMKIEPEVLISSCLFEAKEQILLCFLSHFYAKSVQILSVVLQIFLIFAVLPWRKISARQTSLGLVALLLPQPSRLLPSCVVYNFTSVIQFINTVYFRCIPHSKSDNGHKNFYRFPFNTKWLKSDGILT